MKREERNPLITVSDIVPSSPNMKVEGVFNAGATLYKDETILLLRVAESVISNSENILNIPVLDENDDIIVKTFDKSKNEYDYSDPRKIWKLGTKETVYLTSISHIRIARSYDGINFVVDTKPTIPPKGKHENWGIEDPRITKIDDTYYINYSAVSKNGGTTALMTTTDFETYERKGVIFPPENKDVCIYPEKINGKYYAFHRPVPKAFGKPDMWIAKSDNLIHWGEHEHFMGVSNDNSWDNGRIGGGAPSFKTDKGWVQIYHAANVENTYKLGAIVTDLNDPTKIIGKTKDVILQPDMDYEINGFFGNVVFTCGVTIVDDIVNLYYGAADDKICLAYISVQELLDSITFY